VAALWARESLGNIQSDELWMSLLDAKNRNLRREAVRAMSSYVSFEDYAVVAATPPAESALYAVLYRKEDDPEVRAEIIRTLGRKLEELEGAQWSAKLMDFLQFAQSPLNAPV